MWSLRNMDLVIMGGTYTHTTYYWVEFVSLLHGVLALYVRVLGPGILQHPDIVYRYGPNVYPTRWPSKWYTWQKLDHYNPTEHLGACIPLASPVGLPR